MLQRPMNNSCSWVGVYWLIDYGMIKGSIDWLRIEIIDSLWYGEVVDGSRK